MYIMTVLIKLNESFSPIQSQILCFDLVPHINKIFSLVPQEEDQ